MNTNNELLQIPAEVVTKKCTKCCEILSIDNFYVLGKKNKDGKNRIYSRCKKCEREIVLNHVNRDKYIDTYNKNKEIYKLDNSYRIAINNINSKYHHTLNGRIKAMLTAAKNRAKKRGIEFSLKYEDIIIPEYCPILKIPLVLGKNCYYSNTFSIDRIDNSIGYIKDNIRIISMKANTMKNSASKEELIMFSKNIIDYLDNKI